MRLNIYDNSNSCKNKYLQTKCTNVKICILISTISQLGDLFFSYLKRKAKIKDTSNILPGHGGVLDRIDGMIFAIPFGMILYKIL